MSVLYEHPLNERIRNYLKLEQLFVQASKCQAEYITDHYQVYFNALFAIFDTLDRNDIRGELIKDLERLEQHLVVWSKSPEIDTKALEQNLKQIVGYVCQLRSNKQAWHELKHDKLIASLKQRFAIQGGSSLFDLPQLQFWLSRCQTQIASDISAWLAKFALLQEAINLVLRFIRQRGNFELIKSDTGFYQDNGEGLLLLRIKVDKNANYYPTVSGNRLRYSIRFMLPCEQTGRKYSKQTTQFELARC
ncbi:cell division protein ZapD [Thalassotalea euphylliae]|uniref:Cell division protein ZapD n=1 Tax=Thalassotalea euphylliae TaxID=1655234 RepID=A0A3E0TTP7_9GAMM|nr:cell division protein ZapD [Thalassotalea euphylliae]REL28061.1 cell division protein ZapD [Thalassotalea euphylliae]